MTEAIERTLEIDASVEDVWRALTDPTALAGWFGDGAEMTPTAGAVGWFEWEQHGRFAMQVEEFDPPRRLAWRWARQADRPLAETDSTLVEWTLEGRDDGGTTLHLRESGFVDETARGQNVEGWAEELEELMAYLSP